MACVLGLVKDSVQCAATANRLTVHILIAVLDSLADRAHAVAGDSLGDGDFSDCASVSGVSTTASLAEGAAHRTIDGLHHTTRAGLHGYQQLACGTLDKASGLMERAGVRGGVSTRLAFGRDTSKALRLIQANYADMIAKIPDDLRLEDLVSAGHALALLQSATARRPVAAGWAEDAHDESEEERQLLADYLGWSMATYGKKMVELAATLRPFGRAFGLSKPSVHSEPRRPPPSDDLDAIARQTGVDVDHDLIRCELRSAAFRPAYLLGANRRRRSLVLAVRGTWHPIDLLTDLDCRPVALAALGHDGHAHRGMLESARRLDALLREPVREALAARPGYSLVLTGHSLGGGVASLLAALWGPTFAVGGGDCRELRCFVYGPLGTLTLPLAHAAAGCVTSVVNAQDAVPRLSFGSAMNLRAALVALAQEGRGVGLGGGGGGAHDDGLVARVLARLGGGAPLTDDDARWAESILEWLRSSNEEMYVEELLPAGRVLWVPPSDDPLASSGGPGEGHADVLGCCSPAASNAAAGSGGDIQTTGGGASKASPCAVDDQRVDQMLRGGAPSEAAGSRRAARRWRGLVHCANASSFNELQLGLSMLLSHAPQAYAHALGAADR